MWLRYCLAYFLSAALLSGSAFACDNVLIRVTHGGPAGSLIRYRLFIGAFQMTGVIAEGSADTTQCLNENTVVQCKVYEVNGVAVNFDASGSPVTYNGGGGTITFSVTGSPPPTNWKYDARTCNNTALDQYYDIIIDGVKVATQGPIHPGQCFDFHFEDSSKKTIQFARYNLASDGQRTVPDYSRIVGGEDSGWYNSGSGPGQQVGNDENTHTPNVTDKPDKLPWDNSKTNAATDDSVRTGFEALHDLMSQSARAQANEARGQSERLSAVQNAVNGGFANIGGQLVSVKQAVDAVNSSLNGGIANRLDAIANNTGISKEALARIEAKLGELVNVENTAAGYLLTIKDKQGLIVSSLEEIEVGLEGVAKEGTLVATKSTISSEASTTRDTIGNVKTAVDQTKDAIGAHKDVDQAGHQATKTSVDQAKSVLDSIYNATQDARTEANVSLSLINGKLDTANQHLASIKNAADLFNANLDGIGNKLDGISSKIQENTASTSNKLEQIRDLLDHSDHHPDFGGMHAAGSAAGAVVQEKLDQIAGAMIVPTIHAEANNPWMVQLGTSLSGQVWQVDLNPLSYPGIAGIAAWLHRALIWVSTALYIMSIYNVTHEALLKAVGARQAQSASAIPGGSSGLALLVAPLITVALGTIPGLFVSWYFNNQSISNTLASDPLGGGNSVIQMGITLAMAFLPLQTFMSHIIMLHFVYKMKLGAVWWLACTIVRFLVG